VNPCFFYYCCDRECNHTHSGNKIDNPIRKRKDKIRTKKTSDNRDHSTNPEKPRGDIPALMELIEPSEDISDFPEFISDTRQLW
jgi:hypothetical protein